MDAVIASPRGLGDILKTSVELCRARSESPAFFMNLAPQRVHCLIDMGRVVAEACQRSRHVGGAILKLAQVRFEGTDCLAQPLSEGQDFVARTLKRDLHLARGALCGPHRYGEAIDRMIAFLNCLPQPSDGLVERIIDVAKGPIEVFTKTRTHEFECVADFVKAGFDKLSLFEQRRSALVDRGLNLPGGQRDHALRFPGR